MLLNKDKRKGEEQILHSDNNLRYMYYNLVEKLTALGSGPGATGIKNRNKRSSSSRQMFNNVSVSTVISNSGIPSSMMAPYVRNKGGD